MIKTMALKITEETYPIAVACLPDGFALIRKKFVLGHYLVINDLQFPDYNPEGRSAESYTDDFCDDDQERPVMRPRYNRIRRGSGLMLVNFWEPTKLFKKKFKRTGKGKDESSFFEITRK